ncbi:MAG: helix-turn-helix transcriptional regulator [Butyrivibrio sp.]|uniref:helix-turn-helix domain-containing protein n=1 Tax=Butyrivibrio sp. TaxID=28121 RepID=UPI0025BEF135|nr:helix-turn-helix transcriptional regulator [Butyrivibrio sp.]MBQ6589327.1 helix-turn-helix transcriptional regulator [Butyrivibrio sp.]
MTIGQRIFHLLEEKHMTQKEFSNKTGIATTTISDWRKKNTNPGSDKVMVICAALGVTPEYLLSGVTEDSNRGRDVDYMVIPQGTEERELIELFNDLDWLEREHLLEYARKAKEKSLLSDYVDRTEKKSMVKIAEFCDVEVFMDSEFEGAPSVDINYLDDNIQGSLRLSEGTITGSFSKYVLPVIEAWYKEHKSQLIAMWNNKKVEMIPAWE